MPAVRRDALRGGLHVHRCSRAGHGRRVSQGSGSPARIVYTKPENELGSVWGLSADDVYASGNQLLAHWDGKAWSEIPLAGVEGVVRSVWARGPDVWIVTGGDKDSGFIYRRSAGGPWQTEGHPSCSLLTIYGAGQALWAGGSCRADPPPRQGRHLVRGAEAGGGPVMHLWAGSEHEVYAAARLPPLGRQRRLVPGRRPSGAGLPGHGGGPGRRLRAGNPGALPLVGEGVAEDAARRRRLHAGPREGWRAHLLLREARRAQGPSALSVSAKPA